jgi:hypothetical protein
MVGVLLLVLGIPAVLSWSDWREMQAMRADWAVTGPPCPIGVAMPPDRRAPMSFDYGGARLGRRFGHVACLGFHEDGLFDPATYSVCQFSGPAAIKVGLGGRETVYEPGVGRPATVTIRRGQASCVVGGWYPF